MIVYAFEYCYCRYEAGFCVESLHKTKAGAYKAMREHKVAQWQQERDLYLRFGFSGDNRRLDYCWNELWRIQPYTLEE